MKKKIGYLTENYPRIQSRFVTTGYNLNANRAENIINAGLKQIVFSHYGSDIEDYKFIHGIDYFEKSQENILTFLKMNSSLGCKIKILFEQVNFGNYLSAFEPNRSDKLSLYLSVLKLNGAEIRESRDLHNWGDSFQFRKETTQVCSIVNGFRSRVLQITWEGDVIPCCFDFDASIKFGNIKEHTIDEILKSNNYNNFINAHKTNQLKEYTICNNCDKCNIP